MNLSLYSTSNRNVVNGLILLVNDLTELDIAASSNSGYLNVAKFTNITGAAFSDVSGSLLIEFSADGVNSDYSNTIAIVGNDKTNTGFSQLVVLPYVKFTYTNGAVAQAAFRFAAYGRMVS